MTRRAYLRAEKPRVSSLPDSETGANSARIDKTPTACKTLLSLSQLVFLQCLDTVTSLLALGDPAEARTRREVDILHPVLDRPVSRRSDERRESPKGELEERGELEGGPTGPTGKRAAKAGERQRAGPWGRSR